MLKVKLMHFMEYVLGWGVTGLQHTPWSYIHYVPENALINTIVNTHVVFGADPILGHLTAVQCGGRQQILRRHTQPQTPGENPIQHGEDSMWLKQ